MPTSAWTLDNFRHVLSIAPFDRYFLNTFLIVTTILSAQMVICTLAAYAFVCFPFRGSKVLFMLVLLQLMIMPEALLIENYRTVSNLGLLDTVAPLRTLGQTYLYRLRSGDSLLSLEQFPLAAGRDEIGRNPPDHRGPSFFSNANSFKVSCAPASGKAAWRTDHADGPYLRLPYFFRKKPKPASCGPTSWPALQRSRPLC